MYETTPRDATFVIPHYADGHLAARSFERTLASLRAQTDPDWQVVVIDDASPAAADRERLAELARSDPGRVTVLQLPVNRGQAACRNLGVQWAHRRGSGLVLFQDADDVAHPRRLEVTRRCFAAHPEVDFAYSSFTVIDEYDRPVPAARLTPSVAEILASHRTPVTGRNAWIRIGCETGYTSLTSTVAIRTDLGLAHPFPDVRGSEDGHTWLRMSAGGGAFAYLPEIPCGYRIPQLSAGSSDRSRIGADYYRRKAEVDADGFRQAVDIALLRQRIDPAEVPDLNARFLRRLALTVAAEGEPDLAGALRAQANGTLVEAR